MFAAGPVRGLFSEEVETDIYKTSLPSLQQMQPQNGPSFAVKPGSKSPVEAKDLYPELKKLDSSVSIAQENYLVANEAESDSSSSEENDNDGHSDQESEGENYIEPNKRAVWLPRHSKQPFDAFHDNVSIDDDDYGDDDETSEKTGGRYEESDIDSMAPDTHPVDYQINTCLPRRSSLRTIILSPPLSSSQPAQEAVGSQSEDENDSLVDRIREMEDHYHRMEEKNSRFQGGSRIPTLTRSNAFGLSPTPGYNLYRRLIDGFISLPNALARKEDMTRILQHHRRMEDLYFELGERESEIREIVASHCGPPSPDRVFVSSYHTGETWRHGRFNLCIPVYASYPESEEPTPLAFKLPLPYMVGEKEFPGNAEEKLRTEAATHVWISQNCPEVPIPKLYGFGVPGGVSFFKPEYVTIWQRIKAYARRIFHHVFRNVSSEFCEYIPQKRTALLNHGYMLTERAMINDDLKPLPDKLGDRHNDIQLHFDKFIQKSKTQNLYRSYAKIMMSLAKIPQPRIGSWTIDNNGQLSLSNRPLFFHTTRFESWGVPSGIPRDTTYTSTDSFYNDCIGVFDNRLEYQRNIITNERAAWEAATEIVTMRSILHRFMDNTLRQGPFIMQLGNLPVQNILIDKEWNVKQFIDVQGICSLPIELLHPPSWITGKDIEELFPSEKDRLQICYRQFTNTLRHEEAKNPLLPDGELHTDSLIHTLVSTKFWFIRSLHIPDGPSSMLRHINGYQDRPARPGSKIAASVFRPYMHSFVESKIQSYIDYHKDIYRLYDGSHGRVYDEDELSYIETQPPVPDGR